VDQKSGVLTLAFLLGPKLVGVAADQSSSLIILRAAFLVSSLFALRAIDLIRPSRTRRSELFENGALLTLTKESGRAGLQANSLDYLILAASFVCSGSTLDLTCSRGGEDEQPQSLPQGRIFARWRLFHSCRTSNIVVSATVDNDAIFCQSISTSCCPP
jgi:hypothetical protein